MGVPVELPEDEIISWGGGFIGGPGGGGQPAGEENLPFFLPAWLRGFAPPAARLRKGHAAGRALGRP